MLYACNACTCANVVRMLQLQHAGFFMLHAIYMVHNMHVDFACTTQ